MYGLVRKALLLRQPPVSPEKALRIARERCLNRGWIVDPALADVTLRLRTYSIVTRNGPGWPSTRNPRRYVNEYASVTVDAYDGRVRQMRLFTRSSRVRSGGGWDDSRGGASAGRPVLPSGPPPTRSAGNALEIPGPAVTR